MLTPLRKSPHMLVEFINCEHIPQHVLSKIADLLQQGVRSYLTNMGYLQPPEFLLTKEDTEFLKLARIDPSR